MLSINKKIGTTNVSFTPTFYKQAYKNYLNGYFRELIALMEQAEIDSHVSGCLIGRRAGFLRDWRVTEISENTGDVAVKDFVQSVFMAIDMNELFEDIQDARLKKFSVIELEWQIQDSRQVITSMKKVNQKYFSYDKNGVLKINFGKDLKEIPIDAALVCENTRTPILLPVLRDYILKEFSIESWASFLETFGEAFIIGKYPSGASKEFKDEIEQGVNALAGSSRGIMPIGTELELKETQRTTGDHNLFTANADKGISIAILGHANAVEQSPGLQVGDNTSSYKVRREIAGGDIRYIENQIGKLVRMLVSRNFSTTRYPLFSMDKSEPIDARERLEVIDSAYDKGYKINPDEYAKLGLFKYEDQEPLQKTDLTLTD